MRTLRRFMARLKTPFTRSRDEQRLREEFEEHIALLADDYQRSGAAILSLALAIGATTAAYRLVELCSCASCPVAEPKSLFFLTSTPAGGDGPDDFDYPTFRRYRETVASRAGPALQRSDRLLP